MKNYFILLLAANVILSQFLQSAECRCVNGYKTKCSAAAEICQPLGGHYSYNNENQNMHKGFPTLYKLKHTRPTGSDKRIIVKENKYESIKLRHRNGAFEFQGSSRSAVIDPSEGHPCACHTVDKILWKIVKALNDQAHRGWLMIVDDRVGTICVGTTGRLSQPRLPYGLPSYQKNFRMAHQCASWFFKLLAELGLTNDGIVAGLEVDQRDGSCTFRYAPHNLMKEHEFDDWNFHRSISNYSFCYVDIANTTNKYPPGIWPGSALYVEDLENCGEYKVLPMPMPTNEFWRSSLRSRHQHLTALRNTKIGPFDSRIPRGIWTRSHGVENDFSLQCIDNQNCRLHRGSRFYGWSLEYHVHPLIGINYDKQLITQLIHHNTTVVDGNGEETNVVVSSNRISYRVDGDRIDYKIQDDIVIVGAFRCVPIARKLVLSPTSTFSGFISFRHPEILSCEHCVIHAAKRTGGCIVGILMGPNGHCTGIGPGVQRSDYIWDETNEHGHYHCFSKEALVRTSRARVLYEINIYDVECKITFDAPTSSGMYKLDTTWTNNFWEFPMFISYNTRSGVGGLPYIRGDGSLDYNIRFMLCYDEANQWGQNYFNANCPDYEVVYHDVNGEEIQIIIAKADYILCRMDRNVLTNSEKSKEEFAIHQITSKDGVDRSYYRMTTTGCVVVPGYPARVGITFMYNVHDPMTIDQCYNGASDDGDKVVTFYNGACSSANRLDNLEFVWALDYPARSCLKKANPSSANPVIAPYQDD